MTETIQQVRVPETPDISDPVLFVRLFEMLSDVRGELGREDLDTQARRRATVLLREARGMIRSTLATGVVAEFDRLAPELTSEPTVMELRLAYSGSLGWLAGLAWLFVPPAQSTAAEQLQGTG